MCVCLCMNHAYAHECLCGVMHAYGSCCAHEPDMCSRVFVRGNACVFFVHQAYAHRHICARGCTYVFLGLLMNKAYAHDDLCEDACMWLLVRSLTRRMLFEMMRCMCFLGHSHEGDVVGSTHCIWILYTTRVNLKLLTYLGLCKTSHYNVYPSSAVNPQAFVAMELQ
jgi:hypothetical protein